MKIEDCRVVRDSLAYVDFELECRRAWVAFAAGFVEESVRLGMTNDGSWHSESCASCAAQMADLMLAEYMLRFAPLEVPT